MDGQSEKLFDFRRVLMIGMKVNNIVYGFIGILYRCVGFLKLNNLQIFLLFFIVQFICYVYIKFELSILIYFFLRNINYIYKFIYICIFLNYQSVLC